MTTPVDPLSYHHVIVAFSGGKDSTACVLHLLDLGVPPERIELWHHDVDGREGDEFMDWPITRDYVRAFAEAFGMPLYYSWREGGFAREMGRDASATAQTNFEVPSMMGGWQKLIKSAGGKSNKIGTRGVFPQTTANLEQRWCSAYLKIDVGAIALRNQTRFDHRRTLLITGERAQESKTPGKGRAAYAEFEIEEKADARDGKRRRWVDRWRPVHKWTEEDVWNIIRRYGVNPHPAYKLGWGRVSCAACIFGNANQWASLRAVNPDQFEEVAQREFNSGKTIHRTRSVREQANSGTPYPNTADSELVALATGTHFTEPIRLDPETWTLPAGAYGEGDGPT